MKIDIQAHAESLMGGILIAMMVYVVGHGLISIVEWVCSALGV
jgi:hypothetical protein